MNKKVTLTVGAFCALLTCVFLSRYWYSGVKFECQAVLRENPAELMPHKLESIASCIEGLRRESLDESIRRLNFESSEPDDCNQLAGHAAGMASMRERISADSEILQILANRRLLKIVNELEALPQEQSRVKALSCFDSVMTHFEKVVVSATSSIQMRLRECRAVFFALYCAAEFGTAKDLVDAFARMERSEIKYLRELRQSKKHLNIGPTTVFASYPGARLRMNLILSSFVKLGKTREHAIHCDGLIKEILPVPKWDAPFMTLDAVKGPFKQGDVRPSFINPDGTWKEYVIYDWPPDFYLASLDGPAKQLERVQAALEALRVTINGTSSRTPK